MSIGDNMEQLPKIKFYAVRNKEGKWFRRKGYGGYGDTWTNNFGQARIYSRIGPARGVISFFANNYPTYGIPSLLELQVTGMTLLDETDRIKKQQERKQRHEATREQAARIQELKMAEDNLKQAQQRLKNLKTH